MYEYLVEHLVSINQVVFNLNRTTDKGLISELYRKQLNKLALKYFGVDKNGNYTDKLEDIVAYRCPYSNKIITDLSKVQLEHILPVSCKGGTVIFNCIPVLGDANSSKHDKHLIEWLYWKGHFDYKNLDRILNYIFEAYDLYIEGSIDDDTYDDGLISAGYSEIQNDDLSVNELKQLNKVWSNNNNITYYQLLLDIISELSNYKDVSEYNKKLQNLEKQGVFGEINEIEELIKTVQTNFKEILSEDSMAYLKYSMKIDMKRLLKSLKNNNYKEELMKRLNYIKELINENKLFLNDYFRNLATIEAINPIYFNLDEIHEEAKNEFVESIKTGYDIKVLMLIDMIKHAKDADAVAELLKAKSTQNFTTYKKDTKGEWVIDKEYGKIGTFYDKIQTKNAIQELSKTDLELKDKLDEYYMTTKGGQKSNEGTKRRQEIFINMIKHAKDADAVAELLKHGGTQKFTTYKGQDENGEWIIDKEYAKIGNFYQSGQTKQVIQELSKTDLELRDKLDEYYMTTASGQQSVEGNKRRREIFIDMIKHAKDADAVAELLKQGSTQKFTTYKGQDENGEWIIDKEYAKIGNYYHYGERKEVIQELSKTDLELRNKMDEYFMNTKSGQKSNEGISRRREIFIDMIKHAKDADAVAELLKLPSTQKFTTYKGQDENGEWIIDKEYAKIGNYFDNGQTKQVIQELSKADLELRNKIDEYYVNTESGQKTIEGNKRRREIFIEMIKHAKDADEVAELLKLPSTQKFTTYKGQDENGEWIIDKEYAKIGNFYQSGQTKQVIQELSKTDLELRDKLDEYYMTTASGQQSVEGNKRRREIFIDMIKHAKDADAVAELLKQGSTQKFTTYKGQDTNGEWIIDKEYAEIKNFGSDNKLKHIIPFLFFSKEYESSDYDAVRDRVMADINRLQKKHKSPEFKNIYEYILSLDASKKEVKDLIKVRDEYFARRDALIEENERLKQDNGARRIA